MYVPDVAAESAVEKLVAGADGSNPAEIVNLQLGDSEAATSTPQGGPPRLAAQISRFRTCPQRPVTKPSSNQIGYRAVAAGQPQWLSVIGMLIIEFLPIRNALQR